MTLEEIKEAIIKGIAACYLVPDNPVLIKEDALYISFGGKNTLPIIDKRGENPFREEDFKIIQTMKTFNLTANVTISVCTTVEAPDLEAAIEIARERAIEASRFKDSSQKREVWVSDDYDGEPVNIGLE